MTATTPAPITIALAQLPVSKAAVDDNLQTHLAYIERAAALKANVVAFPELSLTGYELALLSQLAMPRDDATFAALTAAAVANNTVVIAGCPLHNPNGKPYIAAVICFPNGEHTFYLKQHLHEGEDVYCAPGTESGLINVNGTRIALAVCADFTHSIHAATAAKQQADVYLASALISPGGYANDAELLATIAKRHQLPVLLANHVSNTGGWQTCGNSGGWNAAGELTVKASGTQPSLVLCRIHYGGISSSVEVMTNLHS
ncbi:carbon-nitrogen hydrolase family protein [Halomonas sp. 707B3]|uniref:carbon-nitrogen hydrolase family protein n=1 Tax=Halomonas sp. 707B3 TaxID=1681043 RepID=UPI00209CEF14|nr:carbon-nitrogen hydrolase family protein [Halomonas sp. 707B3]MCP1319667.1 carbon-nitrogen hydrolase family protein [Halomonas sp. 707B3]